METITRNEQSVPVVKQRIHTEYIYMYIDVETLNINAN